MQHLPIIRRLRINSIKTKLFIPIIGVTLIGVGSIAFLVGNVAERQVENHLQDGVSSTARLVDSRLGDAEVFATTLRASIVALHARNIESAETYRRLIFEQFKDRPEFVVGLGVGQSQNGILSQQSWFAAYYGLDSAVSESSGILLSSPYDSIRYIDGTQSDIFYTDSDRYQTYFLPQQDIWSQPEVVGDITKTAYYSQIIDDQSQWLGTVFVEIDSTASAIANMPVINDTGTMTILSETGTVISNSLATISNETNPSNSGDAATYESIPGLDRVWNQMTDQSGLLKSSQGYWAYERIPTTNWVAVAFVPYSGVLRQITIITVGGTLAVGLLMAVIIAFVGRSLIRRLQPLIAECNRLTNADDKTALLQQQDEIGQLTTSFFNLLEQVEMNKERLQRDIASRVQTEEQRKQHAIADHVSQELQTHVGHILAVIDEINNGDLTVEAHTSSGATGLVAETLNDLIDRLGHVMAVILGTTEQVAQSAKQLERLVVEVSDNAQQQSQSVGQVQTLVETVDELSQDAASQVTETNNAVQLTQSATHQGQRQLAVIFEGIGSLQQSTDQIAKRIQILTSYVELAAQFAKDQKRIASMTRILAVNASMLANRASVQQDPAQFASITREFQTVATQVNDLAAQTNQSLIVLQQRTDQIQTTVSGLDYDVQTIGQQVNDFTKGVEQSRQVFDTIQTASQQVAQTGQQVTRSSQSIADATQTALQSVRLIDAIASDTLNQARMTQDQAKHIELLTRTLLQTIDFFKLKARHLQDWDADVPPPFLKSRDQSHEQPLRNPNHSATVTITANQLDR
ncbi:MAG: methyl-accepting chemotaxis protein [Elainellaceae cyanobacterium]